MEISNKSLGEDAVLDFLWTSTSSAEQSINSTFNFSGFGERITNILPEPSQTEEFDYVIMQPSLTSTQKLSHILPEPRRTEDSDDVIMQSTEDVPMATAVFEEDSGPRWSNEDASMISAGDLENDLPTLEEVDGEDPVQPTGDSSMTSVVDHENDLASTRLGDVGDEGMVQPTGYPDWVIIPLPQPQLLPQPSITPENDIVRQSVPPREVPLVSVPLYTKVPKSAKKGGEIVSCSDGTEYYKKNMGKRRTHLDPTYTCTFKPTGLDELTGEKKRRCNAAIRERTSKDGLIYYVRNDTPHIPHVDAGMNPAKGRKFNVEVKEEAKRNPWTSVGLIYEKKIMEIPIEERSTLTGIKSQHVTERRMRRAKSGKVPKEPVDLDFEVDQAFLEACKFIPDGKNFIKEDITMPSGKRHFIMYTELMHAIMSDKFTWWVDATFKVVKCPFTQLWGVHAFICREGKMKQVTVAFVLMSGKSTADYEAVFEKLKEKCPNNKVNTIVADFEAATWAGAKNVFKDQIKMKGCYFHFTQAIWRKIVKLKIAGDKEEDEDLYYSDPAWYQGILQKIDVSGIA